MADYTDYRAIEAREKRGIELQTKLAKARRGLEEAGFSEEQVFALEEWLVAERNWRNR